MKSRKESRTGRVLKSVFNVRQWADYDRLKAFTLFVGSSIKRVFVPQKLKVQNKKESFQEACKKMNLTDEGLLLRQKALLRLSILMCVLGCGVFSYAIYQFIEGSFKAGFVSIIISMLGFVLAFRYNFWYYQIKEKKLGCSFREWFRQGLLGKKS